MGKKASKQREVLSGPKFRWAYINLCPIVTSSNTRLVYDVLSLPSCCGVFRCIVASARPCPFTTRSESWTVRLFLHWGSRNFKCNSRFFAGNGKRRSRSTQISDTEAKQKPKSERTKNEEQVIFTQTKQGGIDYQFIMLDYSKWLFFYLVRCKIC